MPHFEDIEDQGDLFVTNIDDLADASDTLGVDNAAFNALLVVNDAIIAAIRALPWPKSNETQENLAVGLSGPNFDHVVLRDDSVTPAKITVIEIADESNS